RAGWTDRKQKRQRTAALQDLAEGAARNSSRQRLGVRLSSAALRWFDAVPLREFVRLASPCLRLLICRMEFSIDSITHDDVPGLLELIRELARFEKLEHEVEATAESLTDSLFGPNPVAGALMGRVGGELAGYALYFFTFSSFIGRPGIWLEDLYVRQA